MQKRHLHSVYVRPEELESFVLDSATVAPPEDLSVVVISNKTDGMAPFCEPS